MKIRTTKGRKERKKYRGKKEYMKTIYDWTNFSKKKFKITFTIIYIQTKIHIDTTKYDKENF